MSLFSSLFNSSQTTSNTPNATVLNAYKSLLGAAAPLGSQEYPAYNQQAAQSAQQYVPGLVAQFSPYQIEAMQGVEGLNGYSQPYFNAAAQLAAASANPLQPQQFSAGAVNQYLSPYLQDVMGSAVRNINETNAQQQQQVLGNTIARGAFGGDRGSIAQSELARQQGLANNATLANIANTGYGQALGEFNNQQLTNLNAQQQTQALQQNAANAFQNIGTQGQAARLAQLQALYGAGQNQQQQQQANLSTAYQQYLNQQAYPYQQLSWLSGLINGAAPNMGASTTATSPTIPTAGLISGGLGLLGSLGQGGANQNLVSNAFSGLGNIASSVGSGLSSAGSSILSALGFQDGGRVGYDNGGVVIDPIQMHYGMETQKDVQNIAQDLAGTGVTDLPAGLQALASKGILPSGNAHGGRIHKAGAGSVVDNGGMFDQRPSVLDPLLTSIGDLFTNPGETTPAEQGHGGNYAPAVTPPPKELRHASGTYTEPYEPKGIVPKEEPTQAKMKMPEPGLLLDAGEDTTPPPSQKPVQVAENVNPNFASDAQKPNYWNPKITEVDPQRLAQFQYYSHLMQPGSFGTSLANAADSYAKTMIDAANQQRLNAGTMGTVGQQESASELNKANAIKARTVQSGPFFGAYTEDPNGRIGFQRIDMSGGDQQGATGGNAAPQGAAGGLPPIPDENFGPITPPVAGGPPSKLSLLDQYAHRDITPDPQTGIIPDWTTQAANFAKVKDETQKGLRGAQAEQPTLYAQINAVSAIPKEGFNKAGAGFSPRMLALNYFNTLIPGLGANEQNLTDAQISQKIATYASNNMSPDSAAIWKNALLNVQPGGEVTKEASNELLTLGIVSRRQTIDRGNIVSEYGKKTGGYGGSVDQVVTELAKPSDYTRDQNILLDIMNNHTQPDENGNLVNPVTDLLHNKIDRPTFDKIVDKWYGSNNGIPHLRLSRYFQ